MNFKEMFMNGMLIYLIVTFLFFISVSVSAISEEKCDNVYYFITSNNFKYTNISLINANISLDEIYNYPSLCGKELPQPSLKKLIVYENQQEECNYQDGFGKEYIPFFEIEINDLNCSSLEKWSYLADFEEKQNGFSIKGISAYLMIFVIFILILGGIKIFSGGRDESEE